MSAVQRFTNSVLGTLPAAPAARDWVLWAILLVVAVPICLLRLSPFEWNVPWAEDGAVFLPAAVQRDPLGALMTPYAGYLHTVPRLASAAVVGLLPPQWWPFGLTLTACAVTAFVATAVAALLGHRLGSPVLAVAVWAAVVANPVASVDVNANIANSHWYLLIGAFAALAARQSHPVLIGVGAALVFLAATSDPLTVVFGPLWLLQALAILRPRDAVVPTVFAVGIVLQAIAVLGASFAGSAIHPTAGSMARATAYRVFLGAIAGRDGAPAVYSWWSGAAYLAAVVVVALVLVAVLRCNGVAVLAAMALITGVTLFVLASWIRWYPSFDPSVSLAWEGGRYAVVPHVLILIAIAASISALVPAAARWRSAPAAFLLLLIVALAVPAFTQQRPGGADWAAAMDEAYSACAEDPDNGVSIAGSPPGWGFSASCEIVWPHR